MRALSANSSIGLAVVARSRRHPPPACVNRFDWLNVKRACCQGSGQLTTYFALDRQYRIVAEFEILPTVRRETLIQQDERGGLLHDVLTRLQIFLNTCCYLGRIPWFKQDSDKS